MATRHFDTLISQDESIINDPGSFLPEFPPHTVLCEALPGLKAQGLDLGKAGFLHWVNFALEDPDEIWELEWLPDRLVYVYLVYLWSEGTGPAFAVTTSWWEDSVEVHDYTMIVDEIILDEIRNGGEVYCRAKEWERENLVRSLNDLALHKYDEDSLDEAKRLIDRAIQLSGGGSAYLFNNRGLIHWKMGLTEEAKADFEESIRQDPANGDPYFNLGLIHFDEADHVEALAYLRRAIEISPSDGQFLTELGHLYLEMEKEEEALGLFGKALEFNPEEAQVDFHLGHYYLYKKNQPARAVRFYRTGLEKDPDDQFALADLAVAHWVLGHKRKCLRLRRTLQSHPRLMPYTVSRLVYLNMEMGDYESALRYYRHALSQSEPFEPEWLHYNAALVYVKIGRPEKALQALGLAVSVGGEAVIKRAMDEEALKPFKGTAAFKELVKRRTKRKSR